MVDEQMTSSSPRPDSEKLRLRLRPAVLGGQSAGSSNSARDAHNAVGDAVADSARYVNECSRAISNEECGRSMASSLSVAASEEAPELQPPAHSFRDRDSSHVSVASSTWDLPELQPVHNREHSTHSRLSAASSAWDPRSPFGSVDSESVRSSLAYALRPGATPRSNWDSSGYPVKEDTESTVGDAADPVGELDGDFEVRMQKYQQRRNDRMMKKKGKQRTGTYGNFLNKCAGSKHSQDGLEVHLAVRGMKIEDLEPVSSGCFARVYKGIWNGEESGHGPKTPVAVKCMRSRWSSGTEQIPVWLDREVKVCKTYVHPHLVQCYLASVEMAPYVLLLEYCSGGSLSSLLDDARASQSSAPYIDRFSWHQRRKVADDIAVGMVYLHSKEVVHRDLKPQNVLLMAKVNSLTKEPFAKVGDFGLARTLTADSEVQLLSHQVGSWEHMAPEVIDKEANLPYTDKVDVYSFAMVLYELASGKWPFSGMEELGGDGMKIARFVVKGGRPAWHLVPEFAPALFKTLTTSGWSEDPSERPDFACISAQLRAMDNLEWPPMTAEAGPCEDGATLSASPAAPP